MTRAEIVERFAEAAHNAWLEEKRHRGVVTWPNEHGFEQMVPWSELSEDVREFDRIVVGAITDVMFSDPGLMLAAYKNARRHG